MGNQLLGQLYVALETTKNQRMVNVVTTDTYESTANVVYTEVVSSIIE